MVEAMATTINISSQDRFKLKNNLPPHISPEEFIALFKDKKTLSLTELTDTYHIPIQGVANLERFGAITRTSNIDFDEYDDFIHQAQARYSNALGNPQSISEIDQDVEKKLQQLTASKENNTYYELAIKVKLG